MFMVDLHRFTVPVRSEVYKLTYWGGPTLHGSERIAAVLKVDIAFDVFSILSPREVLGKISMRSLHPRFSQHWVPLSCEIPPKNG